MVILKQQNTTYSESFTFMALKDVYSLYRQAWPSRLIHLITQGK